MLPRLRLPNLQTPRRLLPLLVACAVLSLLCACADSEPDITSVAGTVIFDFVADDEPPSSRLAFFMQTGSEVQRADAVEAVHREQGLRWRVDEPRLIAGSDKQWAGYTNLQPASGDKILNGAYDCFYYDAAGNEDTSSFTVSYPEALLTATAATAKDCIKTTVSEYIALYNEDGELMFFNKRRSSWRTNGDIMKDYRNAFTLRRCLVAQSNGIICLLPTESLKTPAESSAEDTTHDE